MGREALVSIKERGLTRKLCCLVLDDPSSVVLGKEPILAGDRVIGYVTSANYGYTVGKSIAYGYLPIALAEEGSKVDIQFFGERSFGHRDSRATLRSGGRAAPQLMTCGRLGPRPTRGPDLLQRSAVAGSRSRGKLNQASSHARISSSSSVMSSAARLSVNCSRRLAPTIALVIPGCDKTQASAACTSGFLRPARTVASRSTTSKTSSFQYRFR